MASGYQLRAPRAIGQTRALRGDACRPVDDPSLAQGLTLPELSVALGEVAFELDQRRGQRPALAGGPKPRIDLVEPSEHARPARPLDDALAQLAEEMLVRRSLLAAVGRGLGVPVGFVQED